MGGLATNIVPEMVEIHGEARSHNLSEFQAISDKIKGTFKRAITEQGDKHQVTVQRVYSPYALTPDMPVISIAQAAMSKLGW